MNITIKKQTVMIFCLAMVMAYANSAYSLLLCADTTYTVWDTATGNTLVADHHSDMKSEGQGPAYSGVNNPIYNLAGTSYSSEAYPDGTANGLVSVLGGGNEVVGTHATVASTTTYLEVFTVTEAGNYSWEFGIEGYMEIIHGQSGLGENVQFDASIYVDGGTPDFYASGRAFNLADNTPGYYTSQTDLGETYSAHDNGYRWDYDYTGILDLGHRDVGDTIHVNSIFRNSLRDYGGQGISASTAFGGYPNEAGFYGDLTFSPDNPTDPVPEPATIFLLGAGIMGLTGADWFRKRKKSQA